MHHYFNHVYSTYFTFSLKWQNVPFFPEIGTEGSSMDCQQVIITFRQGPTLGVADEGSSTYNIKWKVSTLKEQSKHGSQN